MNWIFKRKISLDAVRAAQKARQETIKSERTKTDEMEKAVSGLLDDLLTKGFHNGR
jgi:hypothetical protein